jgi:hypothetical protein
MIHTLLDEPPWYGLTVTPGGKANVPAKIEGRNPANPYIHETTTSYRRR